MESMLSHLVELESISVLVLVVTVILGFMSTLAWLEEQLSEPPGMARLPGLVKGGMMKRLPHFPATGEPKRLVEEVVVETLQSTSMVILSSRILLMVTML